MGPCGFIPFRLSIFRPDLGTSILLFKIPMGNWFRSLCTGPVYWLRCTMVDWIVWSVWFAVSVLSLSEILIDPPISVVGNKILAGCFVSFIQFLVILFPSRVSIFLDSASILSIQVSKSFDVPTLIILLEFCSMFFLKFVQFYYSWFVQFYFSHFFQLFFSYLDQLLRLHLVQKFACKYTLICPIFVKRGLMIFLTIFLSTILFLMLGYNFTIDGNFCNFIEMCSTLLWIRCITFGFFMTTINMFPHVLFYGMYFLYLRIVNIQNLFCLTDVYLLCCTCAFKCWSAE